MNISGRLIKIFLIPEKDESDREEDDHEEESDRGGEEYCDPSEKVRKFSVTLYYFNCQLLLPFKNK